MTGLGHLKFYVPLDSQTVWKTLESDVIQCDNRRKDFCLRCHMFRRETVGEEVLGVESDTHCPGVE